MIGSYRCRVAILTIFLLTSSLLSPKNAYCYLDPGSGSYVLQLVIGSLLGLLFAIKLFWNRIKEYIKNVFTKEKDSNPQG